ncbi:MAG: carboxypeptidase-like regulatory domain-containing protein [Deltaproteobacteria bacterium]|nr:carboxypeptidase-like regulatory domain-containing protein [Deltaproteobacteria bacterium]
MARACFVVVAAGALAACEVVTPTNPFDPGAPPDQQEPGSLAGVIVLVDSFDADARERQLGEVRVGLQDEGGRRVSRDGELLAVKLTSVEGGDASGGSGRFLVEGLLPGRYSVVVEGVPAVYVGTAPATVNVFAGGVVDVGELVFTFLPGEGEEDGPGSISGTVTAEGGATGPRRVSIFQRRATATGSSIEARRTVFTGDDGLFSVTGLALGTYAVVVEADGFTPAYRLDLEIGTGAGASLAQTFDGEDAILVHPVSAVLLPSIDPTVVVDQGIVYVRGDEAPLTVLSVSSVVDVGVTRMRLSTDAGFVDAAGASAPFVEYQAAATVPLLPVEGTQVVHVQFEARSAGGFAFTSPTFTLSLVRDVSPPRVVEASLLGLDSDDDGSFLSPARLLAVRVDGLDDVSALKGIGIAIDAAPANVEVVIASPGLQRLDRSINVDADGARTVFIVLEDRAGNRSDPVEIPVVVDVVAPSISLGLLGGGNTLRSREAQLVVTSALPDDVVAVFVGLQGDIDESAPEPLGELTVLLPSTLGAGTVAFEAVAVDAVGNRSLIASLTVNLELLGSVSGTLSSDGVPGVQASVVGTTLTLLSAAGANVDTIVVDAAALDADGGASFVFATVPEAADYSVRASLDGHADVTVRNVDVVNATETDAGLLALLLARGDVRGFAKRSDVVNDATAHGGITVSARLVGGARSFSDPTTTDASGAFLLRGLPRTLAGERYEIAAALQEYGAATASTTLTSASADVGVLVLPRARGDFDVCRPLDQAGDANCTPIEFTNSTAIDVRLRDATDVAALIVGINGAASESFPLGAQNRTTIAVDGASDGVLSLSVQAEKLDGSRGEVLSTTIILDTVAPGAATVTREAAAGSRDPRFTAQSFIDVVVAADAGTGDVAPLGSARVVVADSEPAGAPSEGFVACAPDTRCRIELVDDEERLYRAFAFACDVAGNCADAESVFVIRDVTRPSSANGASFGISAAGSVVEGGAVVLPSPFYSGVIGLGHAQTLAGDEVLDEEDAPVPEVFAFRFSLAAATLSRATIQTFSDPPVVDDTRNGADVVVPALVQSNLEQTVLAQLIDAAGNASDPITVRVLIDASGPDAVVVVNGGLPTNLGSVPFALLVPPGGEAPLSLQITVDNAAPQTFAVPLSGAERLTLPDVEGLRRVVTNAFDRVGNATRTETTVVVDTSAPRIDAARCVSATCTDDGLAASTILTRDGSATVSLALTPFDAITSVATVEIQFVPALGAPNTIQTRAVNAATGIVVPSSSSSTMSIVPIDAVGNRGQAFVRGVQHDVTAPVIASVVLAGGNTKTNQTQVAVAINVPAGDAVGLRLASSTSFSGPVAVFRADDFFVLAGADAPNKQVCAEVRDAAGNTSSACSTIELDRVAPIGTVSVASALTRADTVTATLAMPADTEQVAASTSALSCDPLTTSYVPAGPPSDDIVVSTAGGDGVRTVFACFLDGAGNFALATTTLTVDRTPPTVALTLNGGAVFATTTTPTALVSASSDATNLALSIDAALNCDTANYSAAFTTAPAVVLPSAEGSHTVRVCVRDAAGNVSSAPASSSIVLDTTRPVGTVVVNAGLAFTNSTAVSLSLTASSDAVQVAIANAATLNCNTAQYVGLALTTAHQLVAGDALKTVSVCLKDGAGLVTSASFSDNITLDTTAPTGTVVVAGGALTTSVSPASVALTFAADVVGISVFASPVQVACTQATDAPTSTTTVDLLPDSNNIVHLCLRDGAGNFSAPIRSNIFFESAAGDALVIAIEGGAATTRRLNVPVSLFRPSSDFDQMKVVEAQTLDCNVGSGYIAFADTFTFTTPTLTTGTAPSEGTRTVTACIRKSSDTTQTKAATDTIFVDTFLPAGTVTINSGAAVTSSSSVTATLTNTFSAQNEVITVSLSETSTLVGSDCSGSFEAFAAARTFAFTGADGTKTLFACLRDGAGNTREVQDTISLDSAPPSPVSITAPALTTNPTINVGLLFPTDAVQVALAEGFLDCANTTTYVATPPGASPSLPLTLSAVDGARNVIACFKDLAGNTSQASAPVTLDRTGPSGTIVVDAGNQFSTDLVVSVAIQNAVDAVRMARVESATPVTCSAQSYVAFVSPLDFTLSSADGTKTVQVCLEDAAGNQALALADSIVVDRTAPNGTVQVNGNAVATSSTNVTLLIGAGANTDVVSFAAQETSIVCNSTSLTYQPFTTLAPFLLSAGDAAKTVLVCLKDAAGNTSTTPASDAINLDTAQPLGGAVAIVDGDGFLQAEPTASLTVSWTTAGDVTQVKAGEGAVDCSSAQGYAAVTGTSSTLANFAITATDGTKLVIACLKDAAGNIATAQDTSLRDNTRPTVTNVACTTCSSDGATTFSQSSSVTLALSSDESGSGLREARVAVDAGAEATAVLTNGTLTVNGLAAGARVLRIKATDNAGNTSTSSRDITVTIDGAAPTLTQLLLNESNAAGNATVSRTVNVSIVGASSDTAAMSVVEVDGNGPAIASCATAVYAPFVPGFTRTLPAVDGTKAVSVCLKDLAGNKSAAVTTTTIRLDATAPSLVAAAVVIQDGGDNFLTSVTGGVNVQLNWTTIGDVVAFKLGENSVDCGSEPYVRPGTIASVNTFTQPAVALSTLDGTKVVVACFKDAAGNVTSAQDTTTLDQAGPNGLILAAGGADFFTNASEDVIVTARMSTDAARFSITETTATNPTCASPSVSCAAATYQTFAGSVVDGALVATKTINLGGAPATENLKCFEGCFEDAAGNRSTTATIDAITFDKSAPAVAAGNVTLVGADKLGASSTLTRTPFITVAVAGAPADTASYRVSEDGSFAGGTQAFVPFTSSATAFSLSPGDALKTLSVQLRDTAGNVGSVTTRGITLDATGPQSASVSIEGGALFTRNLGNTAAFGTTGASEMQISVDGTLDTEPFVGFVSSSSVTFAGVDGTKTVAVAFRDDAGNTSAASDTIVLDRVAPVGGTVVINGGSAVTNNTTVTLTLTPPADAVDMSVGGAAFVPVTSTILAAIAAGDCTPGTLCKSVAVIFRDAAGNAQGTGGTDTIELDTAPPSSTSLLLASTTGTDAAGFTTTGTVNVTFSYASGAGQGTQVKHGEGAVDCSGTAGYIALDGTSPDTATNVVLSGSEGTKSYSACFKDAAGNITSSSSSVIADRLRPSGVVTLAGGNTVVNTLGPVTVTIIAADDVNRMAVSPNVLNCATATYSTFASPTSVTFVAPDATKTVHVCLQDQAGNVTAAEITDAVVVDTTDPLATLTIAGGTSVNTLDITLEIDPTTADVVEMAASEVVTLDCDSAATIYDPFSASSTFFLAAGSDGPRNLSVCLRDAVGNTTLLTQALALDRGVPVGSLALTTTNGFVLTTAVTAALTVTGEGASFPAGFKVKSGEGLNCADDGGYTAATGSTTSFGLGSVALAGGEGGHVVTTCLKDAAGNVGTTSASVNVDLTAPLNLSVRCNSCAVDSSGNLFSATTAPKIGVEAQDPNANGFVREVGITIGAGGESLVPFDDEVTATLAATQTTQAVSVRFKDAAGRFSAAFVLSITLDTLPPGATLVTTGVTAVGSPTTLTRNPNIRITLSGASNDITQLMISEDSNFVGAAFVPFANPATAQTFFLLSQGDGAKTVSAKIRDRAGNEVLLAVPTPIVLDTQAPTNATVLIGAGAERTTVANPAVAFNAVGATQLSIITPEGAAGAGFTTVTFPRTQAVVIEDQADDGTKTVLAVFRDNAGNETAAASDSILLDREAPTATSVSINNAATFTNSVSVSVGVVGSGADFMQISVDGVADEAFVAFDANASATLVPGSCPSNVCTVSVCLKDFAGNLSSPCRSDTITLDTVVPSGLLLSLEAGAVTTRDTTPAVTLTYATGATEAAQFALGEGINCATSTFADVGGVSPQVIANALTLSAGDGPKAVTACFRDAAGNIASVVDQILLDTTAPSGLTIAVVDKGGNKTNLTGLLVSLNVPLGVGDAVTMALSDATNTALNCATASYSASQAITLNNTTNETKTIHACFQDAAGNRTAAPVADTVVFDNQLNVAGIAFAVTGVPSATVTRQQAITATVGGMNTQGIRTIEVSELANFADATPFAVLASATVITVPFQLSAGDGDKTVRLRLTDDAGNVNDTRTAVIELDTTPPTDPQLSGSAVRTNHTPAFTVTLAPVSVDDGSGLRSPPYDLILAATTTCPSGTGGSSPSCTWDGVGALTLPNTALREGENRIRLRAVDVAGNTSSEDVLIVTEDTQTPGAATFTKVTPSDGAIALLWTPPSVTDVTGFKLVYTVNPSSGVTACPSATSSFTGDFAVQGASPVDVGANSSFSLTGLPNGLELCVGVVAYDATGNQATTLSTSAKASTTPFELAPVTVGSLTTTQLGLAATDAVGGLATRDNMLYVAAANQGLIELDVANENCFALTSAASFTTCTNRLESTVAMVAPSDIVIHGAFAFVAEFGSATVAGGLRIFELKNGTAPNQLAFLQTVGGQSLDDAFSVAVHRDVLALAHAGGVALLDLTNIWASIFANPTLSSNLDSADGVTTSGFFDVDIQADRLAVGGTGTNHFFNISNPAAPTAVSICSGLNSSIRAVDIAGKQLFLTGVNNLMVSCSLTTSAILSSTTTERARMAIIGSYAVTVGRGGLEVIDLSIQGDIRFLGRHEISSGSSDAGALAVDRSRMYYADGLATGTLKVAVVDFSQRDLFEFVDENGDVSGAEASASLEDLMMNGGDDAMRMTRNSAAINTSGFATGVVDMDIENGDLILVTSDGGLQRTRRLQTGNANFQTALTATITNERVKAAKLRYPWLLLTTQSTATPVTVRTRVIDIRDWTTTAAVLASADVVTVASNLSTTSTTFVVPTGLSVHRGFVYTAVAPNVTGANTGNGLYRAIYNERTGVITGATATTLIDADADGYAGAMPWGGRMIIWGGDNSGDALEVQRFTDSASTWTNANIIDLGIDGFGQSGEPLLVGNRIVAIDNDLTMLEVGFNTTTFLPTTATNKFTFDAVIPNAVEWTGDTIQVLQNVRPLTMIRLR